MQLRTLLAAALMGISAVNAIVVVITDQPVPTQVVDPNDSEDREKYEEALSRVQDWAQDNGVEYLSAIDELEDFVATATYDIPAQVTDPNAEMIYTTVPEWWSALPTDVREAHEEYATALVSIVNEVYDDAAPTPAPGMGLGAGLAMAAAAGAVFL